MIDGVGEVRPRRRPRDFSAVVVIAPTDEWPAVVAAGLGDVDLVAPARAELAFPERAGLGVDREALDIAVAVGPDLGLGARALQEGVVERDRAVRVDADELTQVVREILGRLKLEAFAGRDEQLTVRCESQKAFERCARRVQPTAAGGGRCSALAGL